MRMEGGGWNKRLEIVKAEGSQRKLEISKHRAGTKRQAIPERPRYTPFLLLFAHLVPVFPTKPIKTSTASYLKEATENHDGQFLPLKSVSIQRLPLRNSLRKTVPGSPHLLLSTQLCWPPPTEEILAG